MVSLDGGLQAKSMTSYRAEPSKMAGMRYHGNVMTTTRWRLYVILHLQQHSHRLNLFIMEPEGSLPHSQVPATCAYLEADQSGPCHLSQFLNTHLNIILPSMSTSPQWSLSLRFPQQTPAYASPLPHTRYMPRPSHSSRFYHTNNILCAVQIIKLTIM